MPSLFWRIAFAFKTKHEKPKSNVRIEIMPAPKRKPIRKFRISFAAWIHCQNAKFTTYALNIENFKETKVSKPALEPFTDRFEILAGDGDLRK